MTGSLWVLLALIAAGLWTAVSPRIAAAVALVALCVLWPFVNSSFEGPVLWVVGRGHGLTASDLLSPIGLAGAAARLWLRSPWLRRRRLRRQPAGRNAPSRKRVQAAAIRPPLQVRERPSGHQTDDLQDMIDHLLQL